MRLSVCCAAVCAAASFAARPAEAQTDEGRPLELGIDAGLTFNLGDDAYTTISVPGQRFRVGFFTSDAVSVEPAMSFNYAHFRNGSSKFFNGELGVLIHTPPAENDDRFYVRPFAGYTHSSISSDGSDTQSATQPYVGGGLGAKMPFTDQVLLRLEANFARSFKSGDTVGRSAIGALAGLSFYTK